MVANCKADSEFFKAARAYELSADGSLSRLADGVAVDKIIWFLVRQNGAGKTILSKGLEDKYEPEPIWPRLAVSFVQLGSEGEIPSDWHCSGSPQTNEKSLDGLKKSAEHGAREIPSDDKFWPL